MKPNDRKRMLDLIVRASRSKGGDRRLTFVGATQNVARDGGILESGGWRLDEYRQNPVFLYAHQHEGLPLGRSTDVYEKGGELRFDVEFPERGLHPFADTVFDLYRTGFMKATSVGFRVRKTREPSKEERERGAEWVSTDHDLLELSAVPVGADPGALMVAARALPKSAAKHLRQIGLDGFVDLAREVEKMKHEVVDRDGTLVLVLREPAEFGKDAEFSEHDLGDGVVATVGTLEDGLAIQGLRFEGDFDAASAQAWVDEGDRVATLLEVRLDEESDDEEEDVDDEDREGDEEVADDEDDVEDDVEDEEEREDAPPADDEEEEEDDDEERVYTRSDVANLLRETAAALNERADEIASPSDDSDEEEEEKPDEDGSAPRKVPTSEIRGDPYGIEALARAYAGEK